MKRAFIPYLVVLFLLIWVSPGLKSQDLFVDAGGERIQVCTDRTMYISGEKICFSAAIYNVQDRFVAEFSRIFYCELITPHGNRIAGGKYLVQNSSGHGCLAIPEETTSGIYFLKCYTRFMRNLSTDQYKYIMLKIINPYKTEVLSGNDATGTMHPAANSMNPITDTVTLSLSSSKTAFVPREEINLKISRRAGKEKASGMCLAVIPESTYGDMVITAQKKPDTVKQGLFFPESRGVSLSGQLIEKESGKPVAGTKVNLSVIGDKDILVLRTDSSGRFFFALPDYYSFKDIFISADDLPGFKPEILIDNDFCSRPVYLPFPMFTLNDKEKKAAYGLVVNSRISSLYNKPATVIDSIVEKPKIPFYGKPSNVFFMEKYIELPTLGEYFSEMPVMVKLRKVQGKKQFRFYTNNVLMSLYDPLLLVDWVAVNDIEKILAMSPLEINRIELVDSLYIKGNITYGGIISFVSKKNNFAGISLPTSGTFVNYQFLDDCTWKNLSDPLPENIPDSRSTVYWNPLVQTNTDGIAGVSFTAPDTPGTYIVLLRQINKTGEVYSKEITIVVQAK